MAKRKRKLTLTHCGRPAKKDHGARLCQECGQRWQVEEIRGFGDDLWWARFSRLMEWTYGPGIDLRSFPLSHPAWSGSALAGIGPDPERTDRLFGLSAECCGRELLPLPEPFLEPEFELVNRPFRDRWICLRCNKVWDIRADHPTGSEEFAAEWADLADREDRIGGPPRDLDAYSLIYGNKKALDWIMNRPGRHRHQIEPLLKREEVEDGC